MTPIDKIFFRSREFIENQFDVILAIGLFFMALAGLLLGLAFTSCTTANTQEPSAINGFGAAIQATVEPKTTAPKGETTKEVKALDFTAPQYFMTVQIYYYTACSHLYDEASEQSDCVKHALECAAKNVTDVKWLAGCLEVRE